jgi:ferredoxin-NADP reductase
MLLITAGSGITPVMAMLRSMKQRGHHADVVHVHSAPSASDVIFHEELRLLEDERDDYRLHLQLTDEVGHLDFDDLAAIVDDWEERPTWACGPPAMLDTLERVWSDAGVPDEHLHMERFVIARTDKGGEGGTVTFAVSGKTIEVDGATSLLEAGEQVGIQMPFGCRMGICQTCVLPLESGHVRDFRSGTEHGEGDRIQTCISAASGDCTINV